MAINSDYVQQMSTQLATYEVQSSLDRLNRNESRYKAQREALSALRTSLSTFKSAMTKLNSSTSSMLTNSATFSQEETVLPRFLVASFSGSLFSAWPALKRP